MSSSPQYLQFLLEQLSDLPSIFWRPMMGEYILYYQDKIIGGIYDKMCIRDSLCPAVHDPESMQSW